MSKNLTEKIRAFFGDSEIQSILQSGENPATQPNAAAAAASQPAAKSPELLAAEQKLADYEAKEKQEKQEKLETAAETFATAEISAGRMLPAEKESFVADYVQAAADDETAPLSGDSRVKRLEARQSARKGNGLTKETINAATNKIVFGQQSQSQEIDQAVEAQATAYDQEMGGGKSSAAAK